MTRVKDSTKVMFQQTESDYDLLADRLQRVEQEIKDLQTPPGTPSDPQPVLDTPDNSDSSSSFLLPNATRSKSSSHYTTPPTKSKQYAYGPNMDYLRKNVNIACTTQEQILEFYIKLRLSIKKGGIHIIPIEEITKEKSIATQFPKFTSSDYQLQSNALFTLLSNENFIPKEFIMVQNCILGYAANMDGFGALKAMLKLTHPLLSRKCPTNVPPVLSDSTDIHSYEQSLRNYYLLHKLYNDTDFTPLEKAKQFLQGIDDDCYSDAVAWVRHQLDTVETLNVPLNDDYNIDNVASTIINITGEYDNSAKTIINTMNKHSGYPSQSSYEKRPHTRHHDTFNKFSQSRRPQQRKVTKAQCFACKQFGHAIKQCTLLQKVLAIVQFQRRNSDKCNHILKQHITNNTVNSKGTFVQTLMDMNVLPSGDESDTYLTEDIIVHSMMINDIDDDDLNSQSE